MTLSKKPSQKKWTLLAYIAGDNSLSDYALIDVQEMCNEGSSPEIYVGVQVDTKGDFDGLIRYEITPKDFTGVGHRTVIERLPEADTGSPKCLTSFLKYATTRYPSDNKIAVIWSHGSGFRAVRRDSGFDDSSASSMNMNEIVSALTKAGINKTNKLTILGFDACLMAMLEVANHFIDHAEILVGSQQTEPGDGWPYDKVLRLIKTSRDKNTIAKGIVNEYIGHYKKAQESGVTQSAIDLRKTQQATEALSELGYYFKKILPTKRTAFNRLRIQSQNYEYADYIDAIHFIKNVSAYFDDNTLKRLCSKSITAFESCILHARHYGNTVRYSNGLSLWFPGRKELYIDNRASYLKLRCNANGSGWVDFLDEYYSE